MKNRIHSEETKRKISEATSGEKHHMFGKHLSEEHKKNLSESGKGKHNHTGEVRNKMSKNHADVSGTKNPNYGKGLVGEDNPNWKGGISFALYCPIWKDKEYKKDIKVRDNHQCRNPNCVGNSDRLVIHHIDYNKKNCHPSNLITLCVSCNAKANFNREHHTIFYKSMVTGV